MCYLKISNKFYLLIFVFILSSITKAQTKGLAVDMQYEQRIQDLRNQASQTRGAYAARYKSLQDKYTYALGLNITRDSPKALPSSGTFEAIITDGGSVYDFITVGVENNHVIFLKTSSGETVFPKKCTDIINFRAIITKQDGTYLELIFTYLFD